MQYSHVRHLLSRLSKAPEVEAEGDSLSGGVTALPLHVGKRESEALRCSLAPVPALLHQRRGSSLSEGDLTRMGGAGSGRL